MSKKIFFMIQELDDLQKICLSLTPSEVKDVYTKLRINEHNNLRNVSLRLFDLVQLHSKLDENEVQKILYGKKNLGAFKKVITRIIEKILDSFIVKENIELNELYDKRTQDIFLLERQLLISEILRYRGLFKLSDQKIEKVIYLCMYYEHYDILIYALERKRRWNYFNANENENYKINKEIENYTKFENYVRQSYEIYLKSIKISIENYSPKEISNFKKHIQRVEQHFNATKSKQIKYYWYYLMLQLNSINNKYHKCVDLLGELVEYINTNKNIYSRMRHGTALLNLGKFCRYISNYESSIQNTIESRKYLLNQKQNNLIVYEQLLLTYFFHGNLTKFKYYLSLIQDECVSDDFKYFERDKFNYYVAVNLYLQGRYLESIKYLKFITKSFDSNSLNIMVKILMIINYIDIYKYDLSDYLIESFRKYSNRLKGKNKIQVDVDGISKLLTSLSLSSYNFQNLKKPSLDFISSINKHRKIFKFTDHEMIPFDEWFEAKVKGVPYDHAEAMKRLKKINRADKIK
jgi:hypothetical protein